MRRPITIPNGLMSPTNSAVSQVRRFSTSARILAGSLPVIAVLVAVAFVAVQEDLMLMRQVVLFACGVGGIFIAEYLLFGPGCKRVLVAMGLSRPSWRSIVVALLVSVPMWAFLPIYGLAAGTPVQLNREWLAILLGVVLVNGLAEEVIHRAFVFGHWRREHSFVVAASMSAAIFAAQHLYLMLTLGAVPGVASVLLAAFLAFPLAYMYERGGNSLAPPAIVHTSSNAPMMLFASAELAATAILPYMAVVLVSIYFSFVFGGRPRTSPSD